MSYKSIGILTGGGDCPGLNAVIRGVAKTAFGKGIEVWGIRNGYGGLVLGGEQIFRMPDSFVSGILHRGGTILGTTNRDDPFNFYVDLGKGQTECRDMSDKALENLHEKGIEALVVIGGDGTICVAGKLHEKGIPLIAVPKTIDNDIPHTERTFGFDTAVHVATEALDRLHTTAESHHRVMVLEVMGRYAGWIAAHSGIAGGADCILIPEIPYTTESVARKIRERKRAGKSFSLVVVAEGAKPHGGEVSVAKIVANSAEKIRLGGIGMRLANELEERTGIEARAVVLGHVQRGGTPSAYDRVLSSRYGVSAAEYLLDGSGSGHMVALQDGMMRLVPIEQVAGVPSCVPVDGELVRAARAMGIAFGDE